MQVERQKHLVVGPYERSAERQGYARASITLYIYGHLIPSMQAEAAKLIDDLVMPIPLHTVAPDLAQEKTRLR